MESLHLVSSLSNGGRRVRLVLDGNFYGAKRREILIEAFLDLLLRVFVVFFVVVVFVVLVLVNVAFVVVVVGGEGLFAHQCSGAGLLVGGYFSQGTIARGLPCTREEFSTES